MAQGPHRNDRIHDGSRDDQRTRAQRDRDRILYSSAFRRLGGVTQVVSPGEGRIFHNRLTHSLKVAQIGRRLAEKLQKDADPEFWSLHGPLDPDVVEAAALGHDLGHPPFGHVAEKELARLVREAGTKSGPSAADAALVEGFEGNGQSFRIITRLAAHRDDYRGLNLTRATLNAVLKYPWMSAAERARPKGKYGAYADDSDAFEFAREGQPQHRKSLEADLMDHADNLAYSVHDLEDFARAGLIPTGLGAIDGWVEDLVRQWRDYVTNQGETELLQAIDQYTARGDLREFLNELMGDRPYLGTFEQRASLRQTTSVLLAKFLRAISIAEDPQGARLKMEKTEWVEMKFLQRMVWVHVIDHPRVSTRQEGERRVIRGLFEAYHDAIMKRRRHFLPQAFLIDLEDLPEIGAREHDSSAARLASDIVSSFSDNEALTMYHRISGISPGSVFDLLHA